MPRCERVSRSSRSSRELTARSAGGSVGWRVGQLCQVQDLLRLFPDALLDRVYGTGQSGGPDVAIAGSVAPKGRVTCTGAGWTASDRWPFVTGCPSAVWFYLNCVVVENRRAVIEPSDRPRTRLVVIHRNELEVVDTWDTMRSKATQGVDVVVNEVEVLPEQTYRRPQQCG